MRLMLLCGRLVALVIAVGIDRGFWPYPTTVSFKEEWARTISSHASIGRTIAVQAPNQTEASQRFVGHPWGELARDEIAEFVNRPLFSASRRPYSPPISPPAQPMIETRPRVEPKPQLPEPDVRLVGLFTADGERRAVLRDEASGEASTVASRDWVDGWEVRQIDRDMIELFHENRSLVVALFRDEDVDSAYADSDAPDRDG